MLKKNLLRVKQLADQNLGRAEKTEVLSEDLQNAEKRVENLKSVLHNIVKKIAASLQSHGVTDQEKRRKKMPSASLADMLKDNSAALQGGVLSEVLMCCSDCFTQVSIYQQAHEVVVETETLQYFQGLLETDLPALKATKQHLKQFTLDMDSVKSRQSSATKSGDTSKLDAINLELEDAENKVLSCKDQYATEMLTFLSKETEISSKVIEWLEKERDYHSKCTKQLDELLPEMNKVIDQHNTRPVYGYPLVDHLRSTGRDIAFVIEVCVSILYHNALDEEGLFRIAGSSSKLKKLKAAFNFGAAVDMEEYYTDVHVVAGALKQYIRELPEPLLTFELFEEFIQSQSGKDRDDRLKRLWTVVQKLPQENMANTRYLIKFLAKLAEHSDTNKMTPSNIAIVFGPNMLWSKGEDSTANIGLSAAQNSVVDALVTNHEYFFPGDVEIESLANVDFSSSLQASESGLYSARHERSGLNNNLLTCSMHESTISTQSMSNIECGQSASSNDLSSHNSNNSDTGDQVLMRSHDKKRDRGMRLSIPSAFNNASDKFKNKLKNGSKESVKAKPSNSLEKKDKKRLKDIWNTGITNMRRSLSQDKLNKLSRSESGRESNGSDSITIEEDEEVASSLQSAIDGKEESSSTKSQVFLKPRYTPISEKEMDPFYTGAPNAPLADPEGDSPLFNEKPARSFDLSQYIPPRFHGDYDTAFALASLKGDSMSYLSKVNSVVGTTTKPTLTSTRSTPVSSLSGKPQSGTDISIVDMETVATTTANVQSVSSIVSSAKPNDQKPSSKAENKHDELSAPANYNMGRRKSNDTVLALINNTTAQFRPDPVASTASEGNLINASSPATNRKNRKAPAPPLPPTPPRELQPKTENTPQKSSSQLTSDPSSSTHSHLSRTESVKKPSIPPPGPPPTSPNNQQCPASASPSGPIAPAPAHTVVAPDAIAPPKPMRPNLPPPSGPAPPVPTADVSSDREQQSIPPVNAYASSNLMAAKSDSPSQSAYTNPFIDAPLEPKPTSAAVDQNKGHNRARSHDYRMRTPPPVPQRTQSVLTKPASAPPKVKPNRPPSIDDKTSPKSSTSSVSSPIVEDVISYKNENPLATGQSDVTRPRMNSNTDATLL